MTPHSTGRRGARLALAVFLLAYVAVLAIVVAPGAFGPG